MALTSTTNKIIHNCGGGVTGFDFLFPITEASDLEVIMTLISTGVETILALTTGYTVVASSNDFANGGTVTTVAVWSALYTITIYRNVPLTQPSTFTENMQTLYQTFENGLNRLTMIDQTQEERIDSALKIKKSDDDANLEIPIKADRASRYLAFDADGEPIASSGSPESVVPVSSFMETLLDDTTALAARATLGAVIGTNVQAYNANLAALAGLILAANKLHYETGVGTLSQTDLTAAARTLLALTAVAGDIPYASATNVISMLAKGTAGQTLRMNAGATAPEYGSAITVVASVASTSGTYIDFTSIPSWVKRISVMFKAVSTNGTSAMIVQIGDSGGVETSGYVGINGLNAGGNTVITTTMSSGFLVTNAMADTRYDSGIVVLQRGDDSTTWFEHGALGKTTDVQLCNSGGYMTLSATLDRVRITMVNGTDAFDAGTIGIAYE